LNCPICQKRKPGRFCPAKAEKICAVCCGTEREVSIDCPAECGYLLSAHRYENDHPRALPADTPLLDARIAQDIIHTQGRFLSAIAFTVAKFCSQQPSATDPDVLEALRAQAESYKTLASGIVYEQPPAGMTESEIFQLLVFVFRMGLLRTNGRPRSRRFIEFLRGQFPGAQELQREQSRIIVP
jgi:hypothetical protein